MNDDIDLNPDYTYAFDWGKAKNFESSLLENDKLRAELLEWKRHAYNRGEENALLYNENGILRALAIKYLNLYLEDFYIEEWTDKWPQDLYDDCVFLNQLPDDGAVERER